MLKKVLIILLIAFFSLISIYLSIKYLSSFRIISLRTADEIIYNSFDVLWNNRTARVNILSCVVIAIANIIISIITIKYLLALFTEEIEHLTLSKVAITLSISFFIFNIVISLYYILFAVILLILSALAIFILVACADSNSGGPVHVRSYRRRNGSYVRGHTRRRPRR